MTPSSPKAETHFQRASVEDFRFRKAPEQMTPEEICEEAVRLRGHISQSAEKLASLYLLLYSSVRRRPADDLTSAYLAIANSGKRLAGAVVQGIRRVGSFDRVLVASKQDSEERLRREKEAKAHKEIATAKKAKKAQAIDPLSALYGPGFDFEPSQLALGGSSVSDLDDLYGEDV